MLYIVSTPIGNLRDISERALDTLKTVDYIFAESPQDCMRLLNAYDIKGKKILKYNDNNKRAISAKLLDILQEHDAAYVTSAGTPGVSDPGQDLVAEARGMGIKINVIPGPSALVSAIAGSGIRARQFTFISFPPKKPGALKRVFEKYRDDETTLVFFESPFRILKTLAVLAHAVPECTVCAAKELTKMFENYFIGTPQQVIDELSSNAKNAKGEFVVIVDFSGASPSPDEEGEEGGFGEE
jgi:16S rRNA (cytidine1402-2'-O)-methyltransferase